MGFNPRVPVPILEFKTSTCWDSSMCRPSVLGLSSGAVIVRSLKWAPFVSWMDICIIGLFINLKPLSLILLQPSNAKACTKLANFNIWSDLSFSLNLKKTMLTFGAPEHCCNMKKGKKREKGIVSECRTTCMDKKKNQLFI